MAGSNAPGAARMFARPDVAIDLEAIKLSYGDRSAQLIELFLEQVPTLIETIATAAEQKNTLSLSQTVHALKGICATTFTRQMRETCVRFEQAIREDNWAAAPEMIDQLKDQFTAVDKMIDAQIKGKDSG